MGLSSRTPGSLPPFGALLRRWRGARRLSQLELALAADVSARHLSFIETGRARPSREMVLLLSAALEVPLRERNALLEAAGFAPLFRETPLEDPQMAHMREALTLILRRHEPFPAVAFDRHWNAVMANTPYACSLAGLLGNRLPALAPLQPIPAPRPNLLRLLFDPSGMRPYVENWDAVAAAVLARVQREASGTADAGTRALLEELAAAPGAPPRSRWLDVAAPPELVIPVVTRVGEQRLSYFTTLTTLGAAQDITLHELRIEAFHPADAETERQLRAAAASA